MGTISTAVWGSQDVHAFDALQAPFLIDRYDLERRSSPATSAPRCWRPPSAGGLVGLAIHEGGLRKPVGAREPLTARGLRRPEDPLGALRRAGRRPARARRGPDPLPIGEVYGALRDGTVDAMEANLGLVQSFQYYEVADFITANVNFWPFPTALVINEDKFNALSEEQQNVLREVGGELGAFSIDFFLQPAHLAAGPLRGGDAVRHLDAR